MIKNHKGFTLLEIMMVAFLFSIISAAIFSVLSTGRNSLSAGESQIGVQQACRNGLDSMIKELRQAGVSTITGVPANGTNYSAITFQIPTAIDAAGITWSSGVQYALGGLNGAQLLRTQSGIQKVLANNISALSFNRSAANPNVVNINITAQKNTFPGFTAQQTAITLVSQVKLRN
ncbi:MAG: prepilin-type N-terminal cleavage/methylation domain-containing protein [Candidatus Omnitrophota bacterium]|nr:prepilin-type N-terminal cleavage/methylation domain-containing protein [Candidatus Omnitrophota bacterium]